MKAIVLSLLLTLSITTAQTEPDPASFFPSAVGNVWEFNTDHGFVRREIVRDSIGADDSKYLFLAPNTSPIYKIDSALNVYWVPFSSSLNWKLYKLDAELGETWRVQWDRLRTMARVDTIYTHFLWGEERVVKNIGYYRLVYPDSTITDNSVFESYTLLVSGIGEFYEFDLESGPVRILQGCIIDGDTLGIITSVNDTDQDIPPNDIALFQNYPNPFNPTTVIKYQLPEAVYVTIKLYDMLGREVKEFINDSQEAGYYELTIDGSDLSSGTYIYRITAGDFTDSKKLLLLK